MCEIIGRRRIGGQLIVRHVKAHVSESKKQKMKEGTLGDELEKMGANHSKGNRADWLASEFQKEWARVNQSMQYAVPLHAEGWELNEMQPHGDNVKTVKVGGLCTKSRNEKQS